MQKTEVIYIITLLEYHQPTIIIIYCPMEKLMVKIGIFYLVCILSTEIVMKLYIFLKQKFHNLLVLNLWYIIIQ